MSPLRIAVGSTFLGWVLMAAVSLAQTPVISPAPMAKPMAPAVEGCPPYLKGQRYDASRVVTAIDTNHDDRLSHDEWLAAGVAEAAWQHFMTYPKIQKQGYVSRKDFEQEVPASGIDANCDGLLTLQEYVDYSRTMDADAVAKTPPALRLGRPGSPSDPNGGSTRAGAGGIPGAGATGAAGAGAPGVPGTAPPTR